MKKYYDILGLQVGASQDEIQESFDRLSLQLDPLKNDNQEFFIEEFEKLQQAYKELSNSTILKSSEKSFIKTNVIASPQEELSKPNNDSITITVSQEKIEELNNKSVNSKVEKTYKEASQGWIIAGFIFSILGGFGGMIVGANYAFGNYKKETKVIGWVMLVLGIFSRAIWQSSH